MLGSLRPGSRLLRRRVLVRAEEMDADVRLVADDDRVVARTDLEEVAGSDLEYAPVVHLDPVAARQHEAQMRDVARGLALGGANVLRPAPAGRVLRSPDRHLADPDEIKTAEREL